MAGPREPFGGVAAIVEDATYPVTARAVDSAEAYAWEGRTIAAPMHRFPPIAINAARMTTVRGRKQPAAERAEFDRMVGAIQQALGTT